MLIGPAGPADGAQPLGNARAVLATLARFNTSDDTAPASSGPTTRLYGPGMTIELSLDAASRASTSVQVMQALVSVNDEPFAWPVLEKLGKATGWRLMDMESGRVMAFS